MARESLRGRQHQAHQPFQPRTCVASSATCCGNTAAAESTWKNTRAPAASTAPDILPTRHYLPQAAKPVLHLMQLSPELEPGRRLAAAPFVAPPGGQFAGQEHRDVTARVRGAKQAAHETRERSAPDLAGPRTSHSPEPPPQPSAHPTLPRPAAHGHPGAATRRRGNAARLSR